MAERRNGQGNGVSDLHFGPSAQRREGPANSGPVIYGDVDAFAVRQMLKMKGELLGPIWTLGRFGAQVFQY